MKTRRNSRPPSPPQERGTGRVPFHLIPFLILFLGIILTYGHTLNYSFHFDDRPAIIQNQKVHLSVLTFEKISPLLLGGRPVANLSYALNYYFGGLNVTGYHLVNILIHLLTAYALYRIFFITFQLAEDQALADGKKRERGRKVALFGALLWALHPVHTQAVTYIVQRTASLAALFFLLSLLFFISGRRSRGQKSLIYFAGSFFSGLLAFGTKENTLFLPLVILLYDLFFISGFKIRFTGKQIRLTAIVAVSFFLGVLWLTRIYQGSVFRIDRIFSAQYGAGEMDPLLRLLSEGRVLVIYLGLLLLPLPSRFNLDYDLPLSTSLFSPATTFFSLLAILFLLGFSVWKARKLPLISFSLIWFFMNLIVESTLLKLDLLFEHRLYLSSMFFFLPLSMMVYSSGSRPPKFRKEAVPAIALVLIVLLSAATWQRNKVWVNEFSLWNDVARKSPHRTKAFTNLGDAYLAEGNLEMAIKNYQRAVEQNPNNPSLHNDLGIAFQLSKNFPPSLHEFQEAIRLDSRYVDPYRNMGTIYLVSNQFDLAIASFKKVIEIDPSRSDVHTTLGIIYHRTGRLAEAAKEFHLGVEGPLKSFYSEYNYAHFLESTGQKKEAVKHYQEAIVSADEKEKGDVPAVGQKIKELEFSP